MINSISLIIGIIASSLAIVISIFSIVQYFRTKYYLDYKIDFRPTLIFDDETIQESDLRNSEIKSLIFVNDKKSNYKRCIVTLFTIKNKSNNPIKNIRIQLEYNRSFFITNEELIDFHSYQPIPMLDKENNCYIKIDFKNIDDDEKRELKNIRKTSVFGDFASELIDIPLLRPGETGSIPFYFMFKDKVNEDSLDLFYGESGFKNIAKRIYKIDELQNFFILNFNIYSENLKPFNRIIKIFEISDSISNLENTLLKIAKSFWLGSFPTPGIYFATLLPLKNWYLNMKRLPIFKRNIERKENGVCYKYEYFKITSPKKETILMNFLENSSYTKFEIKLPSCDYYKLPPTVDSCDSLLRFIGIGNRPFYVRKKTKEFNDT